MQNNFRLSKTKNNILYVLSGVTLALFAGLMLFPTISESTHAEGDEPDDGIAITVNGEVDANLVLFDEGDYKIAKDTVSVSSSAAYGYELFLTTDSEAHQSIYLNDDPTSESRIAPVSGTIAEPATLTNNTWGFAIAGQGNFDNEYDPSNPDPASKFAIIPTTDDQQSVFENNSATAEDSIDFYYGIKVEPTLEVGKYTTSAAYTATAKLPPLTAKAILGDNGNLNFIYNRNTYTVGETYTDNIGETTIRQIYNVPSFGNPQWLWPGFTYANFDPSFHDFKPTSTANWFDWCGKSPIITSLENLNTSNVTNMSQMFSGLGYVSSLDSLELDLSSWDTSKVTNMSRMFSSISSLSTIRIILNDWNVSSVTDMSQMFGISANPNVNLEVDIQLKNWDISNNPTMNYMFGFSGGGGANAANIEANIDLSGWKIGNTFTQPLPQAYGPGPIASLDLNLSGWDVENVTSTAEWFKDVRGAWRNLNIDLSNWKHMTNITNMNNMFYNTGLDTTTAFSLDLSGWNTSSVTTASGMFQSAGRNATTWNIGDLSGWDTGNLTDMSQMFLDAGFHATVWDIGNIKNWNVSNVRNYIMYFDYNQSNIDTRKLPWSIPY